MTKITNNKIRELFGLEPLKDRFMKFGDMMICDPLYDTPGIGDEFFEIYLGDLENRTRNRIRYGMWEQVEPIPVPPEFQRYDTPIDWEFV